jgi:hypothetical protein
VGRFSSLADRRCVLDGPGHGVATRPCGRQVLGHVGPVFSGDSFYPARPEGAGGLHALGQIVTGDQTTAAEREHTFGDMVRVALTAALPG